MGKLHPEIDEHLRRFIQAQHVFFVATAPSGPDGHVNLSPKGLDSFRILGPRTVAYLDFVGSGVETIAHLRQNGRIVIMLCAFEGPPNIVRLHGRGLVLEPQDAEFARVSAEFPSSEGARAVILVDVERVSDSCGFGVPLYAYRGERTQLPAWSARKGPAGLDAYQQAKNRSSIDGLPGLRWIEVSEDTEE